MKSEQRNQWWRIISLETEHGKGMTSLQIKTVIYVSARMKMTTLWGFKKLSIIYLIVLVRFNIFNAKIKNSDCFYVDIHLQRSIACLEDLSLLNKTNIDKRYALVLPTKSVSVIPKIMFSLIVYFLAFPHFIIFLSGFIKHTMLI